LQSKTQKAAGDLFIVLCLLASVCAQPRVAVAQTIQRAAISVDARKVENRISPLLYGQFLEFMFGGIKGGLHAELIRNRSFEEPANAIGLSRDWERYPDDRNDDYALTFHWDDRFAYPPTRTIKNDNEVKEHSLRVEAGDGVIARHGIYQPRIAIRSRLEYRGYFWLKTTDYHGDIKVALESDSDRHQVYAAANAYCDPVSEGDWRRCGFSLVPDRSDLLACFAILFPGRGTVWIDQVSLMPADVAEGGVRRDVFDRVGLLKPAFIRWPGGNVAQDYHWLWGVGPRDERVTWTNLSWKNEPEPSDFGTDEFVMFARALGAEPSLTVNVEGRGATVAEAAAWVEYCNGAATSKYGAMRAANGHAAPFTVKYWEVGNEIWGDWVRGHSDAETYARNYNRYAQAMRAVDPSIKLIAVGRDNNDKDMSWNRTVLREAGRNIDYLAIHHYYGRREMNGDESKLMAYPLVIEDFYAGVKQLLSELGLAGRVKLAINEWGLDLPTQQQYSLESALYGAQLMNVFERSGELVEMSAVSDLVNGWPGGIIQAGRASVFVSPLYLVNQLYAGHRGDQRLATSVDSPTFNTSREGTNVPYLDATASRTADGKTIFIKAVNTSSRSSLLTTIGIQGATPGARANVQTVTASSLDVANDFSQPNAISIQTKTLRSGPRFVVTFPKHSVSVIVLKTQR
jgi:alpha-N-arabinofuranosidase